MCFIQHLHYFIQWHKEFTPYGSCSSPWHHFIFEYMDVGWAVFCIINIDETEVHPRRALNSCAFYLRIAGEVCTAKQYLAHSLS